MAVRTSPKKAAMQPMRTFNRTLRQNQVLTFNNTSGVYATVNAVVLGDPRSYVDWESAAAPFEMFRVKRIRVFALPGTVPAGTLETLLRNVASTQIWTAPDYTNDEATLGTNIKSYQNARFHGLSLNRFTKIVDTDVRLNSAQGGVLPNTTWLPCNQSTSAGGWDPSVLNYSGTQIRAENPALLNVSPSFQATVSLTLEIDIEFKQPGFSTPPTTAGLLPVNVMQNVTPLEDVSSALEEDNEPPASKAI